MLLTSLALLSLSCQLFMGLVLPPTPTPVPPTATATSSPTATTTATPTPLPATPTATFTLTLPASDLQLQVFEELWQAVYENYLYRDFNGQDWDAIHQEYRLKVEAGLDDEAFYQLMREMVGLLGDDHSAFLSPEEVAQMEAEYKGRQDYVGVGILTIPVPERQRVTIINLFPGGPAEQAGLQIHDSILAADGKPIWDESGFRRDLILGPEGSSLTLTVQTPDQPPREVTLIRRRLTGNFQVPRQVLESPGGKRIGYLLLTTFGDSTIGEQVRQALQEMSQGAPLEGLVIDNRLNGGGFSDVIESVLSFFTRGLVGHFIEQRQQFPFRIKADNVAGSQSLSLVVLVGKGTASFGEIFAGILQDLGRAFLIGEQTDGNVEILRVVDFSDGSRALIAYRTFRPLNNPQMDWEQTGIIPDLISASNWDEVTLETDPAVLAALEHFDAP